MTEFTIKIDPDHRKIEFLRVSHVKNFANAITADFQLAAVSTPVLPFEGIHDNGAVKITTDYPAQIAALFNDIPKIRGYLTKAGWNGISASILNSSAENTLEITITG